MSELWVTAYTSTRTPVTHTDRNCRYLVQLGTVVVAATPEQVANGRACLICQYPLVASRPKIYNVPAARSALRRMRLHARLWHEAVDDFRAAMAGGGRAPSPREREEVESA